MKISSKTMAAAFSATLLADVTQNVNWSNKEFVLDLNEHTFAGTGGDFIQLNGGSVEVRNGTVQGKTGASCFITMGGATKGRGCPEAYHRFRGVGTAAQDSESILCRSHKLPNETVTNSRTGLTASPVK